MRLPMWGRSVMCGSGAAGCLLALSFATAGADVGASDRHVAALSPPLTLEQLASMSWCELEQIYRQANPGAIPTGYTRGRAVYCPGAFLTSVRTKMTKAIWHGKLFLPEENAIVNRWCMGLHAVRAHVCYGPGWLDNKPSILMDYRGVSHVIWKDVRDEIREVAPGLYLGIMYRCKSGQPRMKMFFALELSPGSYCAAAP